MIPITKPYIGEEEKQSVLEVLDSGWLVQGKNVAESEEIAKEYTGAKYALCTTSCTTALHLGLVAAGVKEGDEVIVPSFTWIASANAVKYTGATPVFVDCASDTYNVDPELIEAKITERTKAIMPVHIFGLSCDMDRIMEIAEKHNLKVIEDGACSYGGFFKGRHTGTFGMAGCFSFHPRKSATCGEGGMIITNDEKVYELCKSLRDHGAAMSDKERHEKHIMIMPGFDKMGFNYRMTDLQGAVLKHQLRRFPEIKAEKNKLVQKYNEAFKDIPWIQIPYESDEIYDYNYQSYVILIKEDAPRTRNEIMDALKEQGVSTRPGTHSVPNLEYYKDDTQEWNSFYLENNTLSLPLYMGLRDEDIDLIVSTITAKVHEDSLL